MSDCVSGAECRAEEGICQCPSTFYEDVEANACFPRKGFGFGCNSRMECDMTKMLTCVGGSCSCFAPDVMGFNETSQICEIQVGKSCQGLEERYKNATKGMPMFQTRVNHIGLRCIGE